MTDAPLNTPLPQWPKAYPASGASATLKLLNEDFIVTELPLQRPCGEGEHLWLDIEKNVANTAFVAQQLAQQGLWGKTLAGDVMDEAGRPTGPLWGRGRVSTTDQAQAMENGVAERHATLCDGMEHAGLDQERRALVASPMNMSWNGRRPINWCSPSPCPPGFTPRPF